MLAWIPTALAVLAGVGIGMVSGGHIANLSRWRPLLWQPAAVGLVLELLIRATSMRGWFAVLLDIVASGLLIWFCVANIRVGGMILIVIGLSMNLVPTVINWGMPVSRSAVISAGLVQGGSVARTELSGPRHLADDSDHLTFLGEIIPIPPTSQVMSLGDVVLLIGYVLTISSLLRNRFVPSDGNRRTPGRPSGGIPYHQAIAALGDGPAQRRGPGTHPAKMADSLKRPTEEETGVRRLPVDDD